MSALAPAAKPLAASAEAHALLAGRAVRAFDDGEQPVASPCISICRMNEDRSLCLGCYRTLDEIRAWSAADGAARRAIWQQVLARAGLAP